MADDGKAGGTLADDAAKDQNDDGKGDGKSDVPSDDVAGLKSALEKERTARGAADQAKKAADKTVKDLTDRLTALESAGKTDLQKTEAERDRLKSRLDDLTAKQRDAAGREAIRQAAKALGAPEDKRDLVYRSLKSDLAFDDDGEPVGVDQMLKDFKDLYPDLFRASATKVDAAAGTKGKPKEDANSWLRRAAGRPG